MKVASPKLVQYHGSKTSKYVIEGLRVRGKRVRKFFRTQRSGNAWLRKTVARMRQEGEVAIHMPEQLRVDALSCSKRLLPYGKTIVDATEHYLEYLASVSRSCTVAELLEQFSAAKAADGASKRYMSDIRSRLGAFAKDYGRLKVSEIRPDLMDDWLRSLKVAAQTRNNFRRVLHVFFKFAMLRGFVGDNVVTKTARAKVVRSAPAIFSPAQMRTVLENAPDDFVPYLAIGGFAGLRSAEIERLDWSEINLERGFIHVKADKSKSAQRRLVAINDNLLAWLAPHIHQSGPIISPIRAREAREQTCKAAHIDWPSNVLRHSFASYHLAHFHDAAQTAIQLGHSSAVMLYRHYRELVSPDAAVEWWQIFPKPPACAAAPA